MVPTTISHGFILIWCCFTISCGFFRVRTTELNFRSGMEAYWVQITSRWVLWLLILNMLIIYLFIIIVWVDFVNLRKAYDFWQSVTPHFSLGGEVFWAGQHRKSGVGYAGRFNTDKMVLHCFEIFAIIGLSYVY